MKDAVARLASEGYVVYLVGGCVRDFLLNQPVKDFDLVTDARPDDIEKIFPNAVDVGRAFGVMKVPVRGEGVPSETLLEIATFREDLEYVDHRHPKAVRFAGALEDAGRRDFTINGLFFDPKTRKILDCIDGVADLRAGVVRAIGNPSARFHEDALRVLRALRFAARFGFGIDSATLDALVASAKLVKKVSAERVRDELTLMWKGARPDQALQALRDTGLLALLLPEAERLNSRFLAGLGQENGAKSTALVWAAVFSEIGGEDPTRALQSACDRLKLSRDDAKRVTALVVDLPKFNDVFQMREATLLRWVKEAHFDELLILHRAWARTHDGNLMANQFCERLRREALEVGGATRLVSGEDLIQLGFQPGPTFSEILRTIEDLALEKKLVSKEQALEYVVKHFVE